MAMLNLRILAPNRLTDDVVQILEEDPCVSGLAVVRDAAIRPAGDLVFADVAREAANDVISRLRALGLHREGTIEIQPVSTWLSSSGFDCEMKAPGSSADAVVWAEVAQRSYEETELNWTYLSFPDARDGDRRDRHRPGFSDPGDRRNGARTRVRRRRRSRSRPGPTQIRPARARRPHAHLGFHGGDRRHNRPCRWQVGRWDGSPLTM